MDAFSNATGNGIRGDQVSVYQDTYLELIEATNDDSKHDTSKHKDPLSVLEPIKAPGDKKIIKANRPFLFVFVIKRHIVALGRIQNPLWCKFCQR